MSDPYRINTAHKFHRCCSSIAAAFARFGKRFPRKDILLQSVLSTGATVSYPSSGQGNPRRFPFTVEYLRDFVLPDVTRVSQSVSLLSLWLCFFMASKFLKSFCRSWRNDESGEVSSVKHIATSHCKLGPLLVYLGFVSGSQDDTRRPEHLFPKLVNTYTPRTRFRI